MTHDEYAEAGLERILAEVDGVAELGIEVIRRDNLIVVRGEVESVARREVILRHVEQEFPGRTVQHEITIVAVHPPSEVEELT